MSQRNIQAPTEHDIGKLENLDVKVTGAEIAAIFSPPVECLKWLLKKPENLKRNHSSADPAHRALIGND